MCFYADYDYTCDIWETAELDGGPGATCMDCRGAILADDWRKTFDTQQFEECQCDKCQYGCEKECDPSEECPYCEDECGKDFGEVEHWVLCRRCVQVRKAVSDAETEAGCSASESEPPYGELWSSLRDAIRFDADVDYHAAIVTAYPELVDDPEVVELTTLERV